MYERETRRTASAELQALFAWSFGSYEVDATARTVIQQCGRIRAGSGVRAP